MMTHASISTLGVYQYKEFIVLIQYVCNNEYCSPTNISLVNLNNLTLSSSSSFQNYTIVSITNPISVYKAYNDTI